MLDQQSSTDGDASRSELRHAGATRGPEHHRGATLWLTGLPGSGKSTLARSAAAVLAARDQRVEVLDGDELRTNLSADLGFSPRDRDTQVRRVGFVANLLASNGVIVLVPVIAPYAAAREAVRQQHASRECAYFQIHVATPVDECIRRDPKGLYSRAANGELSNVTGFDASYEEPTAPDLRLDTTDLSVEAARDSLLGLLSDDAAATDSATRERSRTAARSHVTRTSEAAH